MTSWLLLAEAGPRFPSGVPELGRLVVIRLEHERERTGR